MDTVAVAERSGDGTQELPSDLPPGRRIPKHGHGQLLVGNPGHDGSGTGRPPIRDSIRQLARNDLPTAIKAASRVSKGESFLVDATGQVIPCSYANLVQAARLLYDIGMTGDAIPDALIGACARVLMNLGVLLNRPDLTLNEAELALVGEALDKELTGSKVLPRDA